MRNFFRIRTHRQSSETKLAHQPAHTFLLMASRLAMVGCCLLTGGPATQFARADEKPARQVTAADMPRIPFTPAVNAVKTFDQARGFTVELVASEPLVADPVDACFDEFGRMYVAEMHGYPFSQEPTKLNPAGGGLKDAGIIRLLEDTDDDGRMDRSTVFARGLSWPTSVRCYNGGVFVIAPRHLYYLKDTDGDRQADVRETVLTGFGRDNVQSVANGLQWGLDNKLYLVAGRNPKQLKHRGQPLFPVGSVDLRFDPKTEKFEIVTGGLQFGHTMDDWGTRFVCSNSNHIQQVIFPQEYLARNPYLAVSGLIRSVAVDGASAQVFRKSPPEPWRIIRQKWRAEDKGYRLVINDDGGWEFIPLDPTKKKGAVPTEYPVGFFTSATGITIYCGDAYPPEFHGNAFVGDVGGNLVHRKTVDASGVVYRAERADRGEEFLRSSDNWFRPVNFVNAPDGTLYVLDMYRETVEHPYSIPEEIKAHLHLTSGRDRGRIYRLVSPGMKRRTPIKPGELELPELVAELGSSNGWNRTTAQRLLWERQDKRAVPLVQELLESSSSPQARVHALYTLAGLRAIAARHIRQGLADPHPRVRAHAVKLSEPLLESEPKLLDAVRALAGDESPHVRFQLAFSLGTVDDSRALDGLADLARDPRNSGDIQTALLSSVGDTAHQLVARLLRDSQFMSESHAGRVLNELCLIVGANPDPDGTANTLAAVLGPDTPLATQQRILTSLGAGLARRGASLRSVLYGKNVSPDLKSQIASLFQRASGIAGDAKQSVATRSAAIKLLAFADIETATSQLAAFLTPQAPQTLQQSAVGALAQLPTDSVPSILLSGWNAYSPRIRRDVVDTMMSRSARTLALLAAVKAGQVKPVDLERDKKQLLMNHSNDVIRSQSRELFGSDINTNRAKVVDSFQDVLDLDGDSQRGAKLFEKRCSTCHRVGDVGFKVAPELASVANKSKADLLIAILDPNREAQPNFNVYTVVTDQGLSFSGIIAAESANSITLRRAEAKEDVILRNNIDDFVATGVSLMPEGLEKDLSKQDLADILAFVKSIKPNQP